MISVLKKSIILFLIIPTLFFILACKPPTAPSSTELVHLAPTLYYDLPIKLVTDNSGSIHIVSSNLNKSFIFSCKDINGIGITDYEIHYRELGNKLLIWGEDPSGVFDDLFFNGTVDQLIHEPPSSTSYRTISRPTSGAADIVMDIVLSPLDLLFAPYKFLYEGAVHARDIRTVILSHKVDSLTTSKVLVSKMTLEQFVKGVIEPRTDHYASFIKVSIGMLESTNGSSSSVITKSFTDLFIDWIKNTTITQARNAIIDEIAKWTVELWPTSSNEYYFIFPINIFDKSEYRSMDSWLYTKPTMAYIEPSNYTNITDIIDHTAPNEVSNLTSFAGDSKVKLTWTNPTDHDFDAIEIHYWNSYSYYRFEGAINNLGTEITNLANGIDYTFQLKTFDSNGNYSKGATISKTPNKATSLDNTIKMPPPGNYSIPGVEGSNSLPIPLVSSTGDLMIIYNDDALDLNIFSYNGSSWQNTSQSFPSKVIIFDASISSNDKIACLGYGTNSPADYYVIWREGNQWEFITLPPDVNVRGKGSLEFDSDNNIHFAYFKTNDLSLYDIYHARITNNSLNSTLVKSNINTDYSINPKLRIDPFGNVYIQYIKNKYYIEVIKNENDTWQTVNLGSSHRTNEVSFEIDAHGHLHFALYNFIGSSPSDMDRVLTYSLYDGTTSKSQIIDSSGNAAGYYNDLFITSNGVALIAYAQYDGTVRKLKLAKKTTDNWTTTFLNEDIYTGSYGFTDAPKVIGNDGSDVLVAYKLEKYNGYYIVGGLANISVINM